MICLMYDNNLPQDGRDKHKISAWVSFFKKWEQRNVLRWGTLRGTQKIVSESQIVDIGWFTWLKFGFAFLWLKENEILMYL